MTAYRRWKGRDFKTRVAEFGEIVWHLKAASAGKGQVREGMGRRERWGMPSAPSKPSWPAGMTRGCVQVCGQDEWG